jgi:PEP-CTERM motif
MRRSLIPLAFASFLVAAPAAADPIALPEGTVQILTGAGTYQSLDLHAIIQAYVGGSTQGLEQLFGGSGPVSTIWGGSLYSGLYPVPESGGLQLGTRGGWTWTFTHPIGGVTPTTPGTETASVPEPSTLSLLALGAMGALVWRRRR